jgi:methionyl-tRNA synthetase
MRASDEGIRAPSAKNGAAFAVAGGCRTLSDLELPQRLIANPRAVGHTHLQMSKQFYITTAIDYVNGQPHVGHAYEKIVADVIARARRSMGEPVFFLTGIDEHGQKVQQAALAEGKTPQVYCDELAAAWQSFAARLNLSHNGFIRTTEPAHTAVVQAILSKLHAGGHLYKAEYEGFYSTRQETFLTDRDRLPDGSFDPIYGEVIELAEENYYFKLQPHQPWLIDYIESNPDFIYPSYRRNETLGFLKNSILEDLCISRPAARLSWGIPLPFDPGYVTYVWFDALINYVTVPAALGDPAVHAALPSTLNSQCSIELWPADAQVIGKDILKFHGVYWQVMLKALGLPQPAKLLVHGFWERNGEKISKTTGNIVDPMVVIDEWGVDAFRYYVVRELDIGPDGNWTDAGFQARYHAELANGLGNLVNRSLSMLKRYRGGKVPVRSDELGPEATRIAGEAREQLRSYQLQAALQTIWSLVNRANQYVDRTAPFKLAKDPGQAERLDAVLYNLTETCRILAVLLWPFLPDAAARIYRQLGLAEIPNQLDRADWGRLQPGHVIGEIAPLFPRKDQPERGNTS